MDSVEDGLQHRYQGKLTELPQAELELGFAVGTRKTDLFQQSQSKW